MRLPLASVAVAVAALTPVALAAPADASSAVRFAKIQYNSPGTDNRSNSSLNAEWVTITNHASTRRTLTGWTLRDASGHVYRFPTFGLAAGSSVRVHTGTGSNGTYNLYWRASNYIWNNSGDKATLKNSAGTTLDTCSWGSGSGSVYC